MKQWYIIHGKHRKEHFLCEQLKLREMEVYFPRVRVKPVNPRAQKEKPYFPGYLFVHIDLEYINLSELKWLPGSIGLVSFGGQPAFVQDDLIYAIRRQIESLTYEGYDSNDNLKPGDFINIVDGPFTGYKAIFDARLSGQERVRVLLKTLQDRQLAVELSQKQIKAL